MYSKQELIKLDQKHFIHPTSSLKYQQEFGAPFVFTRGSGVYVYDMEGKKLLEGMSGLWNVNLGFGREELAKVAYEQMVTLCYANSFSSFSNQPAIELATKLAALSPGDLNAVFFTSGGSEANDTAYKLARYYWKQKGQPSKKKIISRRRGYHGVNIGATSATGIAPFHTMTNSPAPDFMHVDTFTIESLLNCIKQEGADSIAAFVTEPVQGAGGVNVAPVGYLKEVREICREHQILFIADEVITGFGRTGKWFACEHEDVVPDMLLFAKGVTSGYFPLGGVIITQQLHQELIENSEGVLMHGYTYSGHATGAQIALRNIELIEEEHLVENAKIMGERLLSGLKDIAVEFDVISEVRGLGLMVAIEFADPASKQKLTPLFAPKVASEALKRGLIVRTVGFEGLDALVCAPPLIIQAHEIDELVMIIRESIKEVIKK